LGGTRNHHGGAIARWTFSQRATLGVKSCGGDVGISAGDVLREAQPDILVDDLRELAAMVLAGK